MTLPTGSRKVCADAQSCWTDAAPDKTETVPEFQQPPEPSSTPWVLHIRTPSDQESKLAYDENPALLYNLNRDLLVKNSNGQMTQNTQCVNIIATAGQQTELPAFLGGLGSTFPEGFQIYFGYDVGEDLNAQSADTCCLRLYEGDDCTGSEVQKQEECGQHIDDLAGNVKSWKVEGCSGLFTPF